MSGCQMYGKCAVCGKETFLQRTYFHYDLKCECHSPNHFELTDHCKDCTPKEPDVTKILIRTEELKRNIERLRFAEGAAESEAFDARQLRSELSISEEQNSRMKEELSKVNDNVRDAYNYLYDLLPTGELSPEQADYFREIHIAMETLEQAFKILEKQMGGVNG